MTDYRAEFDAEVTFLNGGGLQAQGFRLDIPGPDVSEPELAAAFVRQLGLLMTDRVRLSAVRILQEPHKGLRGRPELATTGRRGVDGGAEPRRHRRHGHLPGAARAGDHPAPDP